MALETQRKVVLEALKAHLAPAVIKELLAFEEVDSDGEAILRLQVVVDASGPRPTADQLFLATGVVRDALAAISDTRFPLLSFPSSDEIPGVAA